MFSINPFPSAQPVQTRRWAEVEHQSVTVCYNGNDRIDSCTGEQQEDSPLIMRVHLVKQVCSGSFTAEICRQEEVRVWLQSGLQMCSNCGQVKAVYRLLLRALHSNVWQEISLSQFYSNITFHTVSDSLCPAVLHRLSDSPLSISCLSSATISMLSGEGLIRRPQQASHPPHQTHCSTSPSCD